MTHHRSMAHGLIIVTLCALAWPAAAVKVVNRDSSRHELLIKCSSTTHGSVGASSTSDIGKGPCTVTVKSSGASASGSGKDELVISKGSISRK